MEKYNQKKYDDKWKSKNREHSNYLKGRTAARSFIRNRATLSDVEELRGLLDEREEKLKKSGQ